MLVDDGMQDKGYSQFSELVKHQYSGAEHGVVRGISIVNLTHYNDCDKKELFPMGYRTYAPDQDRKTKDWQFSKMVTNTVYAKNINAKCILFDNWYASAKNLKLVRRLGLIFFTPQENKRMVGLSEEADRTHQNENDLIAKNKKFMLWSS